MRAKGAVAILVGAGLMAIAACGGSTADDLSTNDAGNGDAGTAGDSAVQGDGASKSDGGTAITCPSTLTAATGACPREGFVCEYAVTWNACADRAECRGGAWQKVELDCQVPPDVQKICPATRAAVPEGAACSAQAACLFPEGRCDCTIPNQGGPVQIDAGRAWVCTKPGAGCPAARPRLGSTCATEALSCNYGACSVTGGKLLRCQDGNWQEDQVACAQ
jgi:hypothetical protein